MSALPTSRVAVELDTYGTHDEGADVVVVRLDGQELGAWCIADSAEAERASMETMVRAVERAAVETLQRTAKWLPHGSDPLDDEALRGIKLRWATSPEWYQADADALIGEVLRLRARVADLEATATTSASADECEACAERDCPHGEPMHHHHDGCPACTEETADAE